MDLSQFGVDADHEKDRLLETFVAFAQRVAGALAAKGFWADFIDPCSGLPVRDSRGAAGACGVRTDVALCSLSLSLSATSDAHAVQQQGVQRGGRRGAAAALPLSERGHVQDPGAPRVGRGGVPGFALHDGAVRGGPGRAGLTAGRCLERRVLTPPTALGNSRGANGAASSFSELLVPGFGHDNAIRCCMVILLVRPPSSRNIACKAYICIAGLLSDQISMAIDSVWTDSMGSYEVRPSTSAGEKALLGRGKVETGEPETRRSTNLKLSQRKKSKRRQQEDATRQVASLLRNESDKLNEQLLIASEKGKQRAVFLLLYQGVDKDRCKGLLGYSPVHHAAARGHLEVLKLLLDFGWSANLPNDALETPLHLACFNGHVHAAEFLLDNGSEINARNEDQETPLFYAARKGQYRVVRLLVRRECDLAAKNRYGDTAEEEVTDSKTQSEFTAGNEDLRRALENLRGHANDVGEHILSQRLREQVLSFLDLKSLGYASQVSYRWHRAADNSSLWKKLGVSRWGLLLNATMGMGAVPQTSMLRAATSCFLRLNLSSKASRRPSSCDQAFLGRTLPISMVEKTRRTSPKTLEM
ncbi:unnamed protein product [Phytophthora fragariaefolia]|uniref:Unnamed protein product n=1 Tax=Phytophthora fragariaefolia TaxID=1490495 RepID=A0A9W6XJR0_9STRA|nr:unnamed protein product [Phytophthora fragariaefolia]